MAKSKKVLLIIELKRLSNIRWLILSSKQT